MQGSTIKPGLPEKWAWGKGNHDMNAGGFSSYTSGLLAPGSQSYLIAVAVLLMLMAATYLLIRRGSVVSVVAGAVLAMTAAFYGLTGGDVLWLDRGPMSSFVQRALIFVGLG